MADRRSILQDRQMAVSREIDRRGIHRKAVGFDSGLPEASLRSYFPTSEPVTVMPVSVLFALIEGNALPLDLLSLLLPDGVLLVRAPAGVDHDEAAAAMRDFLSDKDAAHHPDSPGGREISSDEDAHLRLRLAAVKGDS